MQRIAQVMLRMHRLGTIAAAAKDSGAALQHLGQSREHFGKRLGTDNPISGEVRVPPEGSLVTKGMHRTRKQLNTHYPKQQSELPNMTCQFVSPLSKAVPVRKVGSKGWRVPCAQAQFYHALSRLHVLETKLVGADPFDRVLAPGQRTELLDEMGEGLRAMAAGFGPEHLLVRRARELQAQSVA